MKCPYIHKLCGNKPDCTNMVCRAYFPERQPILKQDMVDEVCSNGEYLECERYIEGSQMRAERKQSQLKLHCPFASNSRCGRPWEWWCKGSDYPFLLTTYEENEHGLPVRDENGDVILTCDMDVIKNSCLSGKIEVYEQCPHYIDGIRYREEYVKIKNKEKE